MRHCVDSDSDFSWWYCCRQVWCFYVPYFSVITSGRSGTLSSSVHYAATSVFKSGSTVVRLSQFPKHLNLVIWYWWKDRGLLKHQFIGSQIAVNMEDKPVDELARVLISFKRPTRRHWTATVPIIRHFIWGWGYAKCFSHSSKPNDRADFLHNVVQ